MPHPLEHKFVLKVQTEKPLTPPQALERTVDQLIGDLAILEERLRVRMIRLMACSQFCRTKSDVFQCHKVDACGRLDFILNKSNWHVKL